MERIEFVLTEEESGERLDRYLAEKGGFSRSAVQRMLEEGFVTLDEKKPAKSRKLSAGERLVLTLPPVKDGTAIAQELPLYIVYEDKHLLVVDKEKGLVVHPAPGHEEGTLVNALLYHCKESLSGIGGELRPGIVHRIDKDTSGLLVVAKDDKTHTGLSEQFAQHSIKREYRAVVHGHLSQPQGTVEAPIGRCPKDRKKMAVVERGGKHAVTYYEVLAEYERFSQLKLRLQTGRTHQIRVHMAKCGHPVAGDTVYGPKKPAGKLQGQCLHAGVLGFVHPITGENLYFESPLPPYFQTFIKSLTITEEKS